MKLYIRLIKPYIYVPMAQGTAELLIAVDGYDWVSEDLEEHLRKNIVIEDEWYGKLVFKERFEVFENKE